MVWLGGRAHNSRTVYHHYSTYYTFCQPGGRRLTLRTVRSRTRVTRCLGWGRVLRLPTPAFWSPYGRYLPTFWFPVAAFRSFRLLPVPIWTGTV